MNHYKYYGHDNNNIPRVFGITKKDCEEQKQLYLDKKKQMWLYKSYPDKLPTITIKKVV